MTNRKSTKKALLTSCLALLLCFSMLVGTTFAWFTDSVTSGTNQIIAGNLDVDVVTADGKSIQDQETLFDEIELWEPGVVAYENLTVKNLGTLALKYQMSVNFTNENTVLSNGEAYGLSTALQVAVVPGGVIGSREQVLAMVAGKGTSLADFVLPGDLLKGESDVYGIVIWWEPSDADNNWNVQNGKPTSDDAGYLHIDLGIKLVATQKDAESDSFGPDYDEGLEPDVNYVSSYAALKEALKNGGTVELMGDITIPADEVITDAASIPVGLYVSEDAVLDLNGHDIIMEEVGETAAVIYAYNAELTIIGEGTIAYNGESAFVIWSRNSSDVVGQGIVNIYDATIRGEGAEVTLLYADSNAYGNYPNQGELCDFYATINVYSGNLVKSTSSTNPQDYMNVKNYGAGRITLYGGTLNWDFDWMVNTAAPNGGTDDKNFITIAEGYAVADNGDGTWTVLPEIEGVTLSMDPNSGLYYNGKATWGTYYIFNASDLQKAADYFAGVSHTSEANICTIELMADIDLAGTTWEPWSVMWINFNGNGHTISNVTTSTAWRSGFFGYAGAVKINDLTLKNVNATGAQVGTLAGSAEGLTTTNVKIAGTNTVTYAAYASETYTETWGGIGAVTGVLTSSTVNAEIVEGATVSVDYNGIETEAAYVDVLTGYLAANSGTVTNNGKISVTKKAAATDNASLLEAIQNGATEVVLAAGNYTMPQDGAISGKTLTISGTKDTVIDISAVPTNGSQSFTGTTLVFDGVTLTCATENYKGFTHAASLTYKNCQLNGLQFLFAENVTFENCDFNSNGAEHSVWTYGAKSITFTECDFTYADRAVNVYIDNGTGSAKVSFEDCTFATTNTASKGAVEINSSAFPQGVSVSFTGCTAPAYGTMVGISGWDSANGANATITVDGAAFTATQWAK